MDFYVALSLPNKIPVATSILAALGVAAFGNLPAQAASDNTIPGQIRILGTGEGIAPGVGIQDSNWTIENFPTSGGNAPASTPVSLYIPSATAAWYQTGTNTTSTTNPGVAGIGTDSGTTYRWGTSNPNNSATSVPNGTFAGNPNYSYVVSTTFEVTKSATYNFFSRFSGDNRANIWLGGTVNPGTATGTCTPPGTLTGCPITGGTYLGGATAGPAGIYTVTNDGISLAVGTYTLNYVVTDFFSGPPTNTYGSNGLLVTTTLFTEAVPGPLPALGAGAFLAYSRKLRRRIKSVA